MLRIGRVLLFPPHSAHISAYFGGSFYLLARSIVFSSVFSQFHRAQVNFTGLVKFHAGRAVNLVAFHTQDLSCWQFLPFYTFVRHSITWNNVLHDLLTKQLNVRCSLLKIHLAAWNKQIKSLNVLFVSGFFNFVSEMRINLMFTFEGNKIAFGYTHQRHTNTHEQEIIERTMRKNVNRLQLVFSLGGFFVCFRVSAPHKFQTNRANVRQQTHTHAHNKNM